jgi:hypothetical protein
MRSPRLAAPIATFALAAPRTTPFVERFLRIRFAAPIRSVTRRLPLARKGGAQSSRRRDARSPKSATPSLSSASADRDDGFLEQQVNDLICFLRTLTDADVVASNAPPASLNCVD